MASSSYSTIPFERYDEEFQSLTKQVQEALQKSDGAEFTQSLLRQCDDLLKQMAIEARGVDDPNAKRELLNQVRNCKVQLQTLKDRCDQMQHEQDKQSLFGNGGNNTTSSSSKTKNQHRERLLQAEQQMESQNETLERARSVMADTEEVALEISTELGRNRETLESAHGRVRQVSGLTNRARRLLQSMSRRQVQQKLAMYAVSGVIVLVVLMLLWNLW